MSKSEKASQGGDAGETKTAGPNPNPDTTFKGSVGDLVELPGGRVGRVVPADAAGEFAIRVVVGGVSLREQGILDALATLWEDTGLRRPGTTPWAAGWVGQGCGGSDMPVHGRPWRTWQELLRTLDRPTRLAVLAYVVDGEVRGALVRALPAIARHLEG